MKYIDNPNIWYNLQIHFKNNIMPGLENDDKVWATAFRRWLKEQGADIEPAQNIRYLRNSLQIAPQFDLLVFEDDRDAMMFLLKWSSLSCSLGSSSTGTLC